MDLAKYQKVEIIIFGVITPTILLLYTIALLLSGEAVFWGRSATIKYYSNDAYLVSLLWFGVSGYMYTYFFLRPLKRLPYSTRKKLLYFSFASVCIGLVSAIVLI